MATQTLDETKTNGITELDLRDVEPRVGPGDKLLQERRFYDYKVSDTKFAGPTLFSRGDTVHRTQTGTLVAKARSTTIRYDAAEAHRRGMYDNQLGEKKRWTPAELEEVEKGRHEWLL